MKTTDDPRDSGNDVRTPASNMSVDGERRAITRNVVLISLAFLCVFTAFQGLSRLQSSLLRSQGMGVTNLSLLYAALVTSCLFLSEPLIGAVGHKSTIPLAFTGYVIWMAANGYATWWTMVPSSVLVGLSAAPLWTAQCSYFTKIAERWASLADRTPSEVVVTRFFGIFFMFFQFSSITGSVITATILKPKASANDTLAVLDVNRYCGVHDCPYNNMSSNPSLEKPSSTTVWIMLGVFIVIALIGQLIVIFAVDDLSKYLREDRKKARPEVCKTLTNTLTHLNKVNQCILIPLTMYSGFEQAFFVAEWTGSFVSCSIGIWKVGLVTLSFGVTNTVMSLLSGHIVQYTGRLPIFTLGMMADLCIQLTLMFWSIDNDKEYVFYVISGMWGLTDAIWQTQINALYGSIFADSTEAAFSNYRLWESIGFILSFAYSRFVCTNIKLYILLAVLLLGMTGYYIVEWRHHAEQQRIKTSKEKFTKSTGKEANRVVEVTHF